MYPIKYPESGAKALETDFKGNSNTILDIIRTANSLHNLLDCDDVKLCKSIDEADKIIDAIACHVSAYWNQKRILAKGTETPFLRYLLGELSTKCLATSACGAGAGGFVVCFLYRGTTLADLYEILNQVNTASDGDPTTFVKYYCHANRLSLHPVRINLDGVHSA